MDDQLKKPSRTVLPKKEASALQTWYLVAYNSFSAVLWATVLGYAVVVPLYKGFPFVSLVADNWVRWTQTLAILEVLHSIFGIVRAPLVTTVMQVWSRLAIVWGCLYLFPSVGRSPVYTTLLLAWGLTETVRYTYFALMLSTGSVPRLLFWLRYNMFFVLYPLGAGSEFLLTWFTAFGPAKGTAWEIPMYLILGQYTFGLPMLYSHMIKQRRKVMREHAGGNKKAN